MLYDYLITFFKVIVGLITTERLVYGALIALAIYLIWVCLALLNSFQRKFYRNSFKLYNYLKNNSNLSINDEMIDKRVKSISSGFYHGFKKFKKSESGKPSDYISRREALDVEINGGVLNQGKSFMKAYISFIFIVLLVFNFAYYGNTQTITFYLIGESLVLPLIVLFVMKIFYFLYTSVKQQLYKSDIEAYYELIDFLDEKFAKANAVQYTSVQTQAVEQNNEPLEENQETKTDLPEEQSEVKDNDLQNAEELTNTTSEDADGEEKSDKHLKPAKKTNLLDEYDVFKKKNIDVEKLINEVPASSNSLPYINVDSDYVIKDDNVTSSSEELKSFSVASNGSEVLGGMMQDMSSIKKNSNNFIDTDKEIAKIDEEKLKELKSENEESSEENSDKDSEDKPSQNNEENNGSDSSDNIFDSLKQFEINNSNDEGVKGEENKDSQDQLENNNGEQSSVEIENSTTEKTEVSDESDNKKKQVVIEDVSDSDFGIIDDEKKDVKEETETANDLSENRADEQTDYTTIVGGFKKHRSKLANGGVEIQKNEPFARRKRQEESVEVNDEPTSFGSAGADINVLSADDNTDNILNSLKGGLYSNNTFEEENQIPAQDNVYTQENPYNNAQQNQNYANYGYGYNVNQTPYQNTNYAGYGYPNYTGYNQNYGVQNQTMYDQSYANYNGGFNTPYEEDVVQEEPQETKKKPLTKSKVEPALKRQKEKVEKSVQAQKPATRGRGRPKKQVFDESLTIKDDKEFDEVLSRAEKLMRKSEEGLSQSQSKRIEKELKMLMDAMNRYKENR